MKFRSLGVAAIALLLPFAAVACGSGGGKDDNNSGDRPTVEEIKTELSKLSEDAQAEPGFEEYIDCQAKGLHESELPHGVVRKVMNGEEAQVDEDNLDKYEKIVDDIGTKCLSAAQP